MSIDFKSPQTILAIILIAAAVIGPILLRERMLWQLNYMTAYLENKVNDHERRLTEVEKQLRERAVMIDDWDEWKKNHP